MVMLNRFNMITSTGQTSHLRWTPLILYILHIQHRGIEIQWRIQAYKINTASASVLNAPCTICQWVEPIEVVMLLNKSTCVVCGPWYSRYWIHPVSDELRAQSSLRHTSSLVIGARYLEWGLPIIGVDNPGVEKGPGLVMENGNDTAMSL